MSDEIKIVAKIILGKFRNCKPGHRFLWENYIVSENFQIPADHKKHFLETINWLQEQNAIKLITSPSPMMEITETGLTLLKSLENAA